MAIGNRRSKANVAEVRAFLGEGTEFNGVLSFSGTVRIDGRLVGEIVTRDILIIGETASVDADIMAGVVLTRGSIRGQVHALERIELFPGCRVEGSLRAPIIEIKPGAFFQGHCSMAEEAPDPEDAFALPGDREEVGFDLFS